MKTTRVSIELDNELLAKIDQFKSSKNIPPRSHIIKHILNDWLDAAEWVESRERLRSVL
jgi:metal-responsive CopG/Arc/MetJ family transcriptional regulator